MGLVPDDGPSADINKTFESCKDCYLSQRSVAGLCFCWILAFCHARSLPQPAPSLPLPPPPQPPATPPILDTDHPLTHSTGSASPVFKSLPSPIASATPLFYFPPHHLTSTSCEAAHP